MEDSFYILPHPLFHKCCIFFLLVFFPYILGYFVRGVSPSSHLSVTSSTENYSILICDVVGCCVVVSIFGITMVDLQVGDLVKMVASQHQYLFPW